jgi:uracil-DNA glycosylase
MAADVPYINALREVSDGASLDRMHDVLKVSSEAFVYYRSFGFDVDMERVAYINAVRCRTAGNAAPGKAVIQACRTHLARWLDVLRPRGVVYLGTFAETHTSDLLRQRNIQYVAISRQRSLASEQRQAQMVVAKAFIADLERTHSEHSDYPVI